jgi:hypothetical protein
MPIKYLINLLTIKRFKTLYMKPVKKNKKRPKKTITVFVIESEIAAKDNLFPEKVAEANETLSNTKFNGSKLKGW